MKFLDPACGSGNFLTETYLSLRKLENETISELTGGQILFGDESFSPIKVSIGQFYGIEINDFAVTVAKTALWIAESQMMKETENILHINLDFLPLKSYTNITEGNALRINWNDVIPKEELNYIMGNPPFVGSRIMNKEQKNDLIEVLGNIKGSGNLDYVSSWYYKASLFIQDTNIKCAFVSTNSISQGEQVAILWKELFIKHKIFINFAYRTFIWDSEAHLKAHVHCVIIGFSLINSDDKYIFLEENKKQKAININGYLLDADNVFIENINYQISNAPSIGMGNQPIDNGNYLFTKEQMQEFIKREPNSAKYFVPWIGSHEFINRYTRYCLLLKQCQPDELRKMPECLKRIEAVKQFRLNSKSNATKKLAESPLEFNHTNIPTSNYIVIPEVSSQRRRYIPIGFLTPDILCSNLVKIIPNASIYDFGILTSNVHMAWMRTVCGRLKSDYRYSSSLVYNNFPWCNPTKQQKEKIEKAAQAILDARALYPNSSFADLYDELTIPKELRKAHQENDKAVMEAYGFDWKKMTESDCVAELMKMYQKIIGMNI